MCVFNQVQLFAWTVACQAPPHGIFQATILKRVAISSSRDWTQLSCVSCIGKGFFITEPPGKLFCKVYWWLYDAISHSLFLRGYYCYFPLGNEKLETYKSFHFQYESKSSAIQLHHMFCFAHPWWANASALIKKILSSLFYSNCTLVSFFIYVKKLAKLWRWWNISWAISNPERWCCQSATLNMPANLENSAVATGLEKVSFHSNAKERQCQRMLKLLRNCTHLTCW